MTDILQAYKKRAPGPLGFASDLKLIDEAGLFPPPQGRIWRSSRAWLA